MIPGPLDGIIFENRQFRGGTEKSRRMVKIRDRTANNIFTWLERQKRQLEGDRNLSGCGPPKFSILRKEEEPLGIRH